jgi:heterodisulfide reductase subunit A-like polyferredoxin
VTSSPPTHPTQSHFSHETTPLLLAFTILASSRTYANPASRPEAIEAAGLVVGATPAGIAAAVSAARSGATVVLLEEKSHVGGGVSAGLMNTDISALAIQIC